ncbi:acetyltransferase [Echinicola pacifica]|uniref:Acetyltransferase n=1 Tax=Echinicola pacifica TaxID=346377 RepID=A0A918Q9A0_9BACT|nr:lysophospholipid acyltransferase family protein [Echinicola pacifica]GGZ36303.1 acetyltransferase [Echinicola pacifica]
MFIFRVISYLPLWFLYLLSDLFFILAYHIIGYRKKVVKTNLEHAFPELSPEEIRKIMRKFYRNLTDSFAETIKMLTMSQDEVARRFLIINHEQLTEYIDQGKIVMGLTAHFFNWEGQVIGFKAQTKPFLDTVYLKIKNPFFEKLMQTMRGRFGGALIEKSDFQRNFIRNRNKPRLIGLAADQRPNREDQRYSATFMNRETGFFEGGEKLAKKFDLPVFYSEVRKIKRGYYQYTYHLITEAPHDPTPHSITDTFIRLLEENIRKEPALYLWSHNRWKNSK